MAYSVLSGLKHPFLLLEGRRGERCAHESPRRSTRKSVQEAAEEATAYDANNLNQYTAIQTGEETAFVPTFDADGNQTKVKTSTGIWNVVYNAENRPVTFTSDDGATIVECTYDKAPEGPEGDWTNAQRLPEGRGAVGRLRVNMGRRHTRKITVNDNVTNHLRYIYRGYLQIAAINAVSGVFQWFIRRESARRPPKGHLRQQAVRAISQMRSICPAGASARGAGTRQPTQPVATRPLGIRKDGTWYTYGWDLTKNICESARRPPKGRLREQAVRAIGQTRSVCPAGARSREAAPSQVFSSGGTILTAYTYTPYGSVTANGNVSQPIQWSSEYNDSELGLVYYNYRHYNPADGRWIGRDLTGEDGGLRVYGFANNAPVDTLDVLGDSAKRKHNLPGKNNRQSSQLKQVDYRIDDFGRSCDKKSMKEVVRYTLKPLTKGHLVGHSFIYCPSVGYRGKYPAGNGFLSAGEIRDDESLYKQYKGTDRLVKVRSYQACPQTLKVMAKHIESSDEIYVLAQAQCENWVLNLIEISKTESYRRMSDKDPVKGALFQFPGGEWPKAKELDEKERRSIGILSTHWTF